MGCPIRTPTDQHFCAAPRGFSQLYTSFIASACQGIHRVPLITSIIRLALAAPAPLKDQNPAHNPTVIRLIVASRIPHRIPNYLWRIYHAPSQARNIHFVFTLLLLHYVKELSSGATGIRTPDPLLAKQVL